MAGLNGRTEDQPFQTKTPEIVCHLTSGVLADRYTEQVGHPLPEVAIMKSVDQVVKQARAGNKTIALGCPNFSACAFTPSSVTAGCTTL
jgi:hypothetical protein